MGFSLRNIENEMSEIKAEIRAEEKSYMRYYLDVSQPIKEDDFLFEIGGVPTIPAGELIGLTGKAKKGKSQFGYYLIGTMLSGMAKGVVRPKKTDYKVLICDTEQSARSLLRCCQRALKFAGLPINIPNPNLIPLAMRKESTEERRLEAEKAIKEELPTLVFIDGIRDLLHDFNSLEQSDDVIQWLLHLTAEYGCTVICVLHQNKKEGDSTMRGHLGTELLNKLTDCFEVSKKDGKFTVTCTDSRNVPCGDVCFSLDIEGWLQTEENSATIKADKKAEDIQRILNQCYKDTTSLTYVELTKAYALEGAVSEATAKRHIKLAKDNESLEVSNGKYQIRKT